MPIAKVELPSKEVASSVRSESPRLKRSEFPDLSDNQRESQHSYSTVDVSSKESGPDFGYMLYSNQGMIISRGIKIVMYSHTN